jgi:hypothetical protein
VKQSFRDVLVRGESLVTIVHSLQHALYQVTVIVDGHECVLTENDGKTFRRHSLSAVREALQVLPLASLTLKQHSAYDEMIGQPIREGENALEVPLALDSYPPIIRH